MNIYFYNNGVFEHEGDFESAYNAFENVWDDYEEEDLVIALIEAEQNGCSALTTGCGKYELSWR